MFRTFHAFVTSTLCPNSKCKESIKILLSYPQELSLRTLPLFHSTHFYSDARAVEQMRGCVVIFILAAVLQFFFIHAKHYIICINWRPVPRSRFLLKNKPPFSKGQKRFRRAFVSNISKGMSWLLPLPKSSKQNALKEKKSRF